MPIIIPNGYANTATEWLLSGNPNQFLVTLGVNPATPDTALEVATAVNGAWKTAYPATSYASIWKIGRTVAYFRDVTGELSVAQAGTEVVGTGSTNQFVPINCCLLVRKNTGLAGRKNRGRMYQPPFQLVEGSIDESGVISSGLMTSLQASVNTLFTELVTREVSPVILHGTSSPPPTQVSGFTAQALLATQRRRMRH